MADIKITVCQQKPMEIKKLCAFLDNLLTSEEKNKSNFVIFPENFVLQDPDIVDIKRNLYLKRIAEIVKKHGIYLILGTMIELREKDKKKYKTCVLFEPNGQILGYYRKRKVQLRLKKENFISSEKIGIFQTKFCKVGILICIDSEDENILNETLKEKPKIVFIPICIRLPLYFENNLDLIKSSRKTALENMGKKFLEYAKKNDVIFVRADLPYYVSEKGVNYGTSLIITPNKIYETPTMNASIFSIKVKI
ncbi:MAG: carbon-nitrogen hydrolase family protein [Promethearchaeota archaeon]